MHGVVVSSCSMKAERKTLCMFHDISLHEKSSEELRTATISTQISAVILSNKIFFQLVTSYGNSFLFRGRGEVSH